MINKTDLTILLITRMDLYLLLIFNRMAALELIIISADIYFFLLTENVILERNSVDSTNMYYFYLGFQAKNIVNTRYVPTNDKSNDPIYAVASCYINEAKVVL